MWLIYAYLVLLVAGIIVGVGFIWAVTRANDEGRRG
jgi:hypothetical protein